jgi:hypothetical protein
LKGLLLIAQFNFQRTAGVKNTEKTHQNPPISPSRLGDKKTRAPNITFYSASQIRVFRAHKLSNPRRLSTGFYQPSVRIRKTGGSKTYQAVPIMQEIF